MTDADGGWFDGLEPDDVAAAAGRIAEGRSDAPADWPGRAVERGFVVGVDEYYARLREATLTAARDAVEAHEAAGDQQLVHAVRAMDDCERTANELAERLAEWAATRFEDAGTGIEGARAVAEREPDSPGEERVVSLARRIADLADERDALRAFVERRARSVAPNLAALAGPVLASRLVAIAGGLEELAKMSSGTVQVLGAEDALFAHLRGNAPSPKHGVIYTHEYVRGTRPEQRGSAARALAGKLTIAARVDHYGDERRPELDEELDERIERIRSRGDDG